MHQNLPKKPLQNNFDKIWCQMKKPMIIGLYLIIIIFGYFYLDTVLAGYFVGFLTPNQLITLKTLTLFGSYLLYFPLFTLGIMVSRFIIKNRKWERQCWFLLICLSISNALCLLLKVFLGRARPELLLAHRLYGFYGFHHHYLYWSFPSGHTTNVMTVAFSLSALYASFSVYFIALGLLIACTRIFLVQHYLTDVLAASYLSLIVVAVVYYRLKDNEFFC